MWRFITFACLLSIMLSACTEPLSIAEQGSREGLLHYSNGPKPLSVDPQQARVSPETRLSLALFEGLTNINPSTMTPEPGVAERWEISDDKLVYTFYLRKDALWSDKRPLTAQDFTWSWQRLLSPGEQKPYSAMLYVIKNAQEYAQGDIKDFTKVGVKATSPHTLTVTLDHPTPYFLYLLTYPGTMPLPRHAIEQYGEAGELFGGWTAIEHLVTNGAFAVDSYDPQSSISLVKSDTYWNRARVKLNGARFYFVDTHTEGERLFSEGKLHFTQGVPTDKIEYYQSLPNSPYRQTLYLASYFYVINTNRPPLNDERVRHALSLAIDRAALNKNTHHASIQPAYSFTPPGIQDYFPREFATYNPDRARQLLAQAGYPNGANWPELELGFNDSDIHRRTALAVTAMWKRELNIDIKPVEYPWEQYLQNLTTQNYDITRMTWIGDYPDPRTFLELFLSNTEHNPTNFASERYDHLILEAAPKEESIARRNAIYTEAETILMEAMPLIPLFIHTSKHLIHPDVHNIPPNILDYTDFKQVSLTPSSD